MKHRAVFASLSKTKQGLRGFTIAELTVVIVVIAILAAITIIAYDTWRKDIETATMKSDLASAATAMESKTNFGTTYPADVAAVYTPGEGITLKGGAVGTSDYCVSVARGSESYFMTKQKSVLLGTCPTYYIDPSSKGSYVGSGLTAKDMSGNGNTATFMDGAVNGAKGPTYIDSDGGGAFEFDGNDKYVSKDVIAYGSSATWMACVKTTASLNAINMFMGSYLPYFGTSTGGTGVIFSNSISGTQRTIYAPNPSVPLNTWGCYAFTTSYDGTNTTMAIFVNGMKKTTATYAGVQGSPSHRFTVGDGYSAAPSGVWYPFKGRISSVAIYPRTLSDAEIKGMFEAQRTKFNI